MVTSPNDTVVAEARDGIAWLVLNRPAALNALDRDMVEALTRVTAEVAEDRTVRAVVLRGAGDHFMAGGDLKWFRGRLDELGDRSRIRDEFERFIHSAHPAIAQLRAMRKPVLAGVQGAVAGFGVSLMLACDLVLAAADAVFTLAYTNIGASPDGGATWHLPRAVGLKRAFEVAILGDRFDAAAAAQMGLVNRVVPAERLEAEIETLAARLATGPTHAYANTKELLNASFGRVLADQLDAEARSFADCATTTDFAEGLDAFIGKRHPEFKGA